MTISLGTVYTILVLYVTATSNGIVTVVNGQQYHQFCDLFANEMPQAPFVSVSSWDLPISANANWTEFDNMRAMSYSAYNEDTAYCDATTGEPIIVFVPTHIGDMPQMGEYDAISIVEEAAKSYNGGMGYWTSQTTLVQRIQMIRNVLADINLNRDEIIRLLMWESSMNYADANTEIDSILEFYDLLVYTALNDPLYAKGQWEDIPGSSTTGPGGKVGPTTTALTKRTALGVVLIGTFHYDLAEIYKALLPALLMGNVVVFKIPVMGGLVHLFTQKIFATYLPTGSIYLVSAPAPMVMPEMLETGKIDAMILHGGQPDPTRDLLNKHPFPHKFKIILQNVARNVAVVLPDLFDPINKDTYYENAMKEMIDGSLTYGGLLNTALKVYFVPRSHSDMFVLDLAERVERVSIGLPWQTHVKEDGTTEYSKITPNPNFSRMMYLQERIDDALRKGARIINERGGQRIGSSTTSLLRPAVLYPIRPTMKFFHDESIGPIILVVPYDSIDEAYDFLYHNSMSQQISIFGQNTTTISNIIDRFGAVVGRININTKCSQAPDSVPFTTRRQAGLGATSLTEILKELTVPTVLSHKNHKLNDEIVEALTESSIFLGNAKKIDGSSTTTI